MRTGVVRALAPRPIVGRAIGGRQRRLWRIDANPYAYLAHLATAPGISLVETPALSRITSASPVPVFRSSAFRVSAVSSVDDF
jgi:hypothetical protein